MREILFRGKRIDNGEWVEGGIYHNSEDEIVFIIKDTSLGYHEFIEVIPETVGQFTGLTDKNGTKIFEGDIVKSCEYDDVYFVKYCADDNYPAFDIVPEMSVECNGLSHLYIVEGIEVIGNVWDHPDLLKGEKNEN